MTTDIEHKQRELAELKQQVAALESEVSNATEADQWNHDNFYGTYYGTVGFVYGGIAAMVSLLLNVIGATVAGKHSLEIIRVYMTFPLGKKAMALSSGEGSRMVIDDGMILALGCCLYIGTGMVLGVLFHRVICRFALSKPLLTRLILGTVLAVAVWVVNFYGILAWLQPALFGGSWITDGSILPWWVALSTHLVFGWTMALMAPLGAFEYYRRPTEATS
ncbi:MAG TPA: hypothetical protein EYG03_23550 [Planctomycetes bacterium]|nr:hypothetical protein [Fuerstiella sp.]HIK94932.1 hypothetical protein [Planctomycetota bacterium]